MSFTYLRQVDTYLSQKKEKKNGGVFLRYLNEKKNCTDATVMFFFYYYKGLMGGQVLESTLCGPVGIEIYFFAIFSVRNNLLHIYCWYCTAVYLKPKTFLSDIDCFHFEEVAC